MGERPGTVYFYGSGRLIFMPWLYCFASDLQGACFAALSFPAWLLVPYCCGMKYTKSPLRHLVAAELGSTRGYRHTCTWRQTPHGEGKVEFYRIS